MARVSLILGGARSGKSARALMLAGPPPHVFIATAQALDGEMRERIGLHQAERGESWGLIEEPLELVDAIRGNAAQGATLLVDCLTLWLSNLIGAGCEVEGATAELCRAIEAAPASLVMVSNEVGLGLVPETPLGRRFRDHQGRLNQAVAAMAEQVEFVAAGLPLRLKP
jgi:adenosylcobinamide kinase/adenosylcobinamide-phosphate guanylyltransferase